jgi:KDO2-lipid IV(A) lauroyltransferase
MAALFAPPPEAARAAIAARLRGRLPVEMLPQGPAIWRRLFSTLREPFGTVFLAVDGVESGDISFPLFGRQPRSRSGIGKLIRLAAATGARLLPYHCLRHLGPHFSIHVGQVIELPGGAMSDADICEQIIALDAHFGPIIAAHIEQWYMAIEIRPFSVSRPDAASDRL